MSSIQKRWGSEEILFSGAYLLKRLMLNSGKETSMHFHYAKCETIYVTQGQLIITFEDNRPMVVLEPGMHYTIREGKANAHRMRNIQPHSCLYIEASTPHECDSERLYL